MLNKAVRAALLQRSVYRELKDEPSETFIALGIVLLSGVALGLGWQVNLDVEYHKPNWLSVPLWVYGRVGSWFVWAGVVYIVGSKLLGGKAGYRQLLRSLGLTFAPGILVLVGFMPVFWPAMLELSFFPVALQTVMSLSMIWLFPAGWIAIQETQQFEDIAWVKALICTILGWLVGVYLLALIMNVLVAASVVTAAG